MGETIDADRVSFRAVDADTWADFEALFDAPGGPKYCWCMAWRQTPEETREISGPNRKVAMRKRIKAGTPVGLLAYMDGTPAGWCSIAPRDTYRAGLYRPGAPPDEEGENIWSIACFYVPRKLRKHGLGGRLLQAAVEHAREQGATVVEAYPVDEDSPSYRHMGFVERFERAGFEEVARAGSRRHVMRLKLK